MVAEINTIQELNVKKANYLLSFEEKMSKSAQLCVSFLISALPNSEVKEGFPALSFTFRELKGIVNADGKRRVTSVEDMWNLNSELMSVPLWYENDQKKGAVAWMSNIEQDKETNQFTYYFHPKLEKHLLNLKSHYTLYNYYYRVCLSTNAMKFYELMKMYEPVGDVVLNIEDDIKSPLGLKGRYKAAYDFKRRVLNPICEELRKYTDVAATYVPEEKDGKRIISLRFTISANEPTHVPERLQEVLMKQRQLSNSLQLRLDDEMNIEIYKAQHFEFYNELAKWGASDEVISNLITNYGIDRMAYIKGYTDFEMSRGEIDDPLEFLITALKSDWMRPNPKRKLAKNDTVLFDN